MINKEHIVILDADSVGHDFTWPVFDDFGKATVYANTKKEEALERTKNATIILTNKTLITKEIITNAPNLKLIGTLATGYNQVDIETAKEKNIPVCNVPDYSTHAVAQHAIGLMLCLASKICIHASAVANGEWSTAPNFCFWKAPIVELYGKTLGIVGFGHIGQTVAALGHAFGMNILAYAPHPKPAPGYTPFSFVSQDELFIKSDFISLHCPLTEENKGFVNAEKLATMKKSAFLINCSRGPLVRSSDLAKALREGTIAGAGLDVVEKEPMRNDDPLHGAPNCLVTPHNSWASVESRSRLMEKAYANIKAFLEGSPINIVNGVTL